MTKEIEEIQVDITQTGTTGTTPSTEVTLDITNKRKFIFSHIIEVGRMIREKRDELATQWLIVAGLSAVSAIELAKPFIPPEQNPFLYYISSYIENPFAIGIAAAAGAFVAGRNALRSRRRLQLIDDKAHQILVGPLPPAPSDLTTPPDDEVANY